MTLTTILYQDYEQGLPQNGHYILGQCRDQNIIVYQAYNPKIADYAVKMQHLGGPAFSFSRMSWIKPNFLWMMYRAGWATKINQERILAIEIPLVKFQFLLEQAVYSSFQPDVYASSEQWQAALETSEVRLQWDPDHAPAGYKLSRRAIQLGMKGEFLRQFATEWVVSIEDITDFVRQQGKRVAANNWDELLVIKEGIVPVGNEETERRLKIGLGKL